MPEGSSADCPIEKFLEELEVEQGTMAFVGFGQLEPVERLLSPLRQRAGAYQVVVTRRATNLYEIGSSGIFIHTRYCYEYAYGQTAIADWNGYSGSLKFR